MRFTEYHLLRMRIHVEYVSCHVVRDMLCRSKMKHQEYYNANNLIYVSFFARVVICHYCIGHVLELAFFFL